ncbi:hypothetical protein GH811_18260 [Acetobacterium malicum]|uniref:Uncharacterized protein n=1 Tax=Acetobacterium malicum TaxID=52692 RepID=A0ABR6Z2D9_9FIRM|nr:hypothetical protein [Acetobacterium malicum]MBC3901546.1 hypothetical protein [Acetobacterium malicum]
MSKYECEYYGFIEILYRDGNSDAFYAGAGLFQKITEEMLKGECIIHVPCRRGKSIEFFSSNVKKVTMDVGGRILKRVGA